MTRDVWHRAAELRHRLYDILEHGSIGDLSAVIVGRLIALLIVVNLAAMTLESVRRWRHVMPHCLGQLSFSR